MSFGRSQKTNNQLAPILRLLDEYDQYSRAVDGSSGNTNGNSSFTPKFDIREDNDAYHLYGEFPGIDQKEIDIEFTDATSLNIKGHVKRKYSEETTDCSTTKKAPYQAILEDDTEENQIQNRVKISGHSENKSKEDTDKYCVLERCVGNFSRTFAFPARVDQDGVRASMKNGILNIFVPKAKRTSGRKIVIE
ncbi:30 kDa heat shock protein [Golovinomyces cichoracearum]|uniref:30 kDa heat shock protein n=1 Tax=Golovinomyces cichoracearum TaxID=62708 RepID=A0A420J315_9PEZI|nr:30 kDa heat shock protein [Golovinomyces cichoracearum]